MVRLYNKRGILTIVTKELNSSQNGRTICRKNAQKAQKIHFLRFLRFIAANRF